MLLALFAAIPWKESLVPRGVDSQEVSNDLLLTDLLGT
jgi:hypothetical protein